MIKAFFISTLPILDFVLLPFVLASGFILKTYRRVGSKRLPKNTQLLKNLGVFPIRDHYYEPLFNDAQLSKSLSEKRFLPGIDFRRNEQKLLLAKLNFQSEFREFLDRQASQKKDFAFVLENESFASGDAEFLFSFVRYTKPSKIIEIGCGSSTKIISHALALNEKETRIRGRHICIEPYEMPWLENFGEVEVVRETLENVDLSIFESLKENDLLFIDSSHIIKPQGDVLREYLEIVPIVARGVFIHVHDIFTPHDYPEQWVKNSVRFWNEQYLLEATLSNSDSYQIVAALNYLKHEEYDALKHVCPYLTEQREPGSFYFRKM